MLRLNCSGRTANHTQFPPWFIRSHLQSPKENDHAWNYQRKTVHPGPTPLPMEAQARTLTAALHHRTEGSGG